MNKNVITCRRDDKMAKRKKQRKIARALAYVKKMLYLCSDFETDTKFV